MQSLGVKGSVLSDKERLRQLITNHVASGGTVREACERFEFETNGLHKASTSMWKWYLFLRFTSGQSRNDTFRDQSFIQGALPTEGSVSQVSGNGDPAAGTTTPGAVWQNPATAAPSRYGAGAGAGAPAHVREQLYRDEPQEALNMPQDLSFITASGITEDEVAHRLLQAVSGIVDDRRQMKDAVQEFKKQIEMLERQLRDSDDERKMLEFKLEKKNTDVDRHERAMLDNQYKYEKLQEEFEQMQTNHQAEHNRLQDKINDLTSRYEELSSDYSRVRRESAKEIERLEMQLRNAELRNTQLTAKYEEIRKDNANLTRRVTDFAHQISTFMDPNAFAQPSLAAVPIRPVADNHKQDSEDRAKA